MHFRMFVVACGYEDDDDCDSLRSDPLFKLAVVRPPESGHELCSQPSMSRLENMSSRIETARMFKIGARVVEKAAGIRIHIATACPDAALFRMLAGCLATAGP